MFELKTVEISDIFLSMLAADKERKDYKALQSSSICQRTLNHLQTGLASKCGTKSGEFIKKHKNLHILYSGKKKNMSLLTPTNTHVNE
jgi:hypothetical protein